jgi:hypothetical protein
MTDERRAELEASRHHAVLIDQQKTLQGALVDGVQQIQAALSRPAPETEAATEPQMVMAGKAVDKGRKLRLR